MNVTFDEHVNMSRELMHKGYSFVLHLLFKWCYRYIFKMLYDIIDTCVPKQLIKNLSGQPWQRLNIWKINYIRNIRRQDLVLTTEGIL